MVETERFFDYLAKNADKQLLLDIVQDCYYALGDLPKDSIFAVAIERYRKDMPVDEESLLKQVREFNQKTRASYYYEAQGNTKAELWENKLAELLLSTGELSWQEKHAGAVDSYHLLFDCLDSVYPEDQKLVSLGKRGDYWDAFYELQSNQIDRYIISLAKTVKPKEYAELLIPFIVSDYPSNEDQIYKKAIAAASPVQKEALKKLITEKEVKVSMENDHDDDYYGHY